MRVRPGDRRSVWAASQSSLGKTAAHLPWPDFDRAPRRGNRLLPHTKNLPMLCAIRAQLNDPAEERQVELDRQVRLAVLSRGLLRRPCFGSVERDLVVRRRSRRRCEHQLATMPAGFFPGRSSEVMIN